MSVLIPIFTIILLGWLLRITGFLGNGFWPSAERATYYVFFPCLLISSLATAAFKDFPALAMAGAMISGIVLVSGIMLFLRPRLWLDGPAFSSVFQGCIRPNTYVGIASALALSGDDGLTLAAIAIVAMVPLVNLLCVPVVSIFGDNGEAGVGSTLMEVIKNPLILGCLGGISLNIFEVSLPGSLFEVVHLLGRAALPLGLLCVGAGLEFTSLGKHVGAVLLASLFKQALLPTFTALACLLYQVPDTAALITVLFTALPASASSYVLARQLGGDETLMASIITLQTMIAAVGLPLVVLIYS